MLISSLMTFLSVLCHYIAYLSCFHHIQVCLVMSLSLIKNRCLVFTSCAASICAKVNINVLGFFACGCS